MTEPDKTVQTTAYFEEESKNTIFEHEEAELPRTAQPKPTMTKAEIRAEYAEMPNLTASTKAETLATSSPSKSASKFKSAAVAVKYAVNT